MRIGIDYTAAITQGAGIGRYTRELVAAILAQQPQHEYVLFFASGELAPEFPGLRQLEQLRAQYPQLRTIAIPLAPRRLTQLWHRLRVPLPIELLTGRLDIVHAPDFVPPPSFAPSIVTIHDLSYMVHPDYALPSVARYLRAAVPRGLGRATAILADSKATQRDLQTYLNIDPQRVTVVYPGVGPQFRPLPADVVREQLKDLQLPERFLLFVSTIEPRKNLVRLFEAYAQVREQIGNIKLVLGGRRGWMYADVFAAIQRLGLHEHIQLLDYVDDKLLPALYNAAWAFVYPSIYEGFGIPALEALACATPVLTANNSSLPEVVGNVAVFVQAEQVESIAEGLIRIVSDQAVRTRLRSLGPQQAAPFTWEAAARQLLDVYTLVHAKP